MDDRSEVRSQLRIPADLHARITEAARQSGRSMNAEIVYRLGQSFAEFLFFPAAADDAPAEMGEPPTSKELGLGAIAMLGALLKQASRVVESLEDSYEEVSGMRMVRFEGEDSDARSDGEKRQPVDHRQESKRRKKT